MLNKILAYIRSEERNIFNLLERLVNINSWSGNPEGVERVAQELIPELEGLGLFVRRFRHSDVADTLIAENRLRIEHGGGVLLSGHLDTVFPEKSGFLKYAREGDTVSGPGAADMKSGVLGAVWALKALDRLGLLADMPVAVVFNADEEITSPFSRPVIEELARNSDMAFVFEPSDMNGAVTTGRKGKKIFSLRTEGRAGHAGACPYPKSSAVEEMCRWVLELEAMNDPDTGCSLNTGTISGGVGVNTIPYAAEAEIECRWIGKASGEAFLRAVEDSAQQAVVPGTRRNIRAGAGRPAMETSPGIRSLYAQAKEIAEELNIPLDERFGGDVSDANFMAAVGTPVLDSLGPSGEHWHSPEESMSAESLIRRTALAAELIRRAWNDFLNRTE